MQTKHRGLVIPFLVYGLSGAAEEVDMVFPGADWVEATPESQGVDAARLEDAMRVLADIGEDHPNGAAHCGNTRSLVARRGRLIWRGPDIDVVTPVHSCTKSLLSTVFGLLVDDGACTPSTLAADLYPALRERYPNMTLGHLASLTSGYSVPWNTPWQEIRQPDFEPGSVMHYNAQGHLLSYLFWRLTGKKTSELWRDRLAHPLGIPDEAWQWHDKGEVDGVGVSGGGSGMDITARQLARVGHLYLNKGLWKGKRILTESWVDLSTTAQVPAHTPCFQGKDAWYNVLPGRYGYGWWLNGVGVDGTRLWNHAPNGTFFMQGNLNNHCIIVPEWELVLVHLDVGKAIETRLYDKVFAVLRKAVVPS